MGTFLRTVTTVARKSLVGITLMAPPEAVQQTAGEAKTPQQCPPVSKANQTHSFCEEPFEMAHLVDDETAIGSYLFGSAFVHNRDCSCGIIVERIIDGHVRAHSNNVPH